jgi:hypothetical protein
MGGPPHTEANLPCPEQASNFLPNLDLSDLRLASSFAACADKMAIFGLLPEWKSLGLFELFWHIFLVVPCRHHFYAGNRG